MTDNRTTELLCKLLEERGEDYTRDDFGITWSYYTDPHTATESMDGTLIVTGLTPEQAIAATLGKEPKSMRVFDSMKTALTIAEKEVEIEKLKRENAELCDENAELAHRRAELEAATLGGGKLTAEQVRDTVERHWHDLPAEYDMPETTALPEFSYDWQAIADELNATLSGGECKIIGSSTNNLMYPDYMTKWYELSCGHSVELKGSEPPNFCPNCGKAVKR